MQDRLQTLYTSGTVFHAFLGERLPDWRSAASLVRKIAENYELPYYTLSPTYSVCKDHGYLRSEVPTCPECGAETEIYSRITGYYRPLRNWNDGKRQEFSDRKTYRIGETDETSRRDTRRQFLPCRTYELYTTASCPQCRLIKPVLEASRIPFRTMDVSEHEEKAASLGLSRAPSLVVYTEGGEAVIYAGFAQIKDFIDGMRASDCVY